MFLKIEYFWYLKPNITKVIEIFNLNFEFFSPVLTTLHNFITHYVKLFWRGELFEGYIVTNSRILVQISFIKLAKRFRFWSKEDEPRANVRLRNNFKQANLKKLLASYWNSYRNSYCNYVQNRFSTVSISVCRLS